MNAPAIILALLAAAVFLAAMKPRHWWVSASFGLTLLTLAWMAQLLFPTLHQYAVR